MPFPADKKREYHFGNGEGEWHSILPSIASRRRHQFPPNARPYPPSLYAYHHYQNWRPYAIYRLEHWGLQYVNNAEVTDDEILAANGAYGGLAELAVLVLPPQQLAAIARKLDLAPAAQHSQQQTNASHPHQQVSFL